MKIVLVLVVIFFWFMTRGSSILMPANVTALINQNAYVYVLGTGMMMCMLIKGNIDLSVGAVVCFVDTVGAILMVKQGLPVPVRLHFQQAAPVPCLRDKQHHASDTCSNPDWYK